MTARDRWEIDIACPKCGAMGAGDVYQYDGWSFASDSRTHVQSVSQGFRIEEAKSKHDSDAIFCITCEIRVK
jgi:hypothetical protein